MKRILFYILLFVCTFVSAQTPFYDDVDVWGELIGKKSITADDSLVTPLLNVGSIRFPDLTVQNTAGGSGTFPVVTAGKGVIDTLEFEIATATIDGTERISLNPRASNYPYVYDTDDPLIGGYHTGWEIQGTEIMNLYNNGFLDLNGVRSLSESEAVVLNVSGEIGFSILGQDKMAVDGNNDSLSAYKLNASFDDVKSNSQTMGATTVNAFGSSKFIMNNTPINLLNFEDTTIASQTDGQLAYGEVSRTLDFVNNVTGTILQLGEEFRHPVWNATGVTIPNGRAVRRTGSHTNGRRVPTVDLAGIGSPDSSDVYGVTTVDILPGTFSYVIKHGDVNGLVTTDLAENKAYLGFQGFMIDTMPDPPYPTIELGEVIYSDNDSGIVDIGIVDKGFSKTPTLSAFFYDSTIVIDILIQNVYQLITNQWNNAYNLQDNVGVIYQGDSAQAQVGGQWNFAANTSFEGTATGDKWKLGLFVNGVLRNNSQRETTGTATGNVTEIIGIRLNAGDWCSVRVVNTTSTRDLTVINSSISLILLHE